MTKKQVCIVCRKDFDGTDIGGQIGNKQIGGICSLGCWISCCDGERIIRERLTP